MTTVTASNFDLPMTNTAVPASELIEAVLELLRQIGVDPMNGLDFCDWVIEYLGDSDYEIDDNDTETMQDLATDITEIVTVLSDTHSCISNDNGYVDYDGEDIYVYIEGE